MESGVLMTNFRFPLSHLVDRNLSIANNKKKIPSRIHSDLMYGFNNDFFNFTDTISNLALSNWFYESYWIFTYSTENFQDALLQMIRLSRWLDLK